MFTLVWNEGIDLKEVFMRSKIVNLNVNPCKMCMPMGAMTAMSGIKKCASILHGSQGCSTYIRRHMATHYNEPIDIASSSLTEEGTVYGGEKNLLQGLKNLIQVYQPEVIGVATTCLAETIGEDTPRIIQKFYNENPEYREVAIVSIATPGYGGTQFEGYFSALYHLVKSIPMDETPNHKVNVITSQLSPADTRYLKNLLDAFSINYILLPDISESLDGGHEPVYQKLSQAGTDIRDIKRMAGAKCTIEISTFAEDLKSPAAYLRDTYGVPIQRCHIPMSLRDNDELLRILKEVSGNRIPKRIYKERSRFLDAMIDSHKYNAEVRAAIYGEPDFVYSAVRLCVENGIVPLIAATGSKCHRMKELLTKEIKSAADVFYIKEFRIMDDIDFQTLEETAKELKINLFLGNSDGRRMAERLGIPLVRRSFPIHDRLGGQRLRSLGYEGALILLDEMTNEILSRKETGFREELYKKYYKDTAAKDDPIRQNNINPRDTKLYDNKNIRIRKGRNNYIGTRADNKQKWNSKEEVLTVKELSIEEKTATHPCYNCGAHQYARMHLAIAPKCNISCNYCLRKYDCPNESRPGVTTKVLTPEEAIQRYLEVKEKVPKLSVVGIAGPGDALANMEQTRETLSGIRKLDPEITFCISTNGLMLPQYANELIELGVSHVTVTMNAVDTKLGAEIYKYVDYMGNRYYGETAAAILLSNQLAGIKMLTSKGIMCKVNIVMLKGINEHHIPQVVAKVKELGGVMTNIMQLIPVKGSVFEHLPLVNNNEIMEMRSKCGESLKQMYHCRQCRADAVGTLDNDQSVEFNRCHKEIDVTKNIDYSTGIEKQIVSTKESDKTTEIDKARKIDDTKDILNENIPKIHIAVATQSGMIVDRHFGQVSEFYIYEYKAGNTAFKERRVVDKYCSGVDECGDREDKMERILKAVADCQAVIAMRIGDVPRTKLNQKGIRTFATCDRIEDSIKRAIEELTVAT